MKNLLLVSLLTLVTSAYAVDDKLNTNPTVEQNLKSSQVASDVKVDIKSEPRLENKPENKLLVKLDKEDKENIGAESANNVIYVYEFDLSRMDKKDKTTHKYLTNNTKSLDSLSSFKDTLQKNIGLGTEYYKGIAFKNDKKTSDKLVCQYTNGLVVNVKAYGSGEKVCPLKMD